MKTLITLTIVFMALGYGDSSFADREVFGVALEEEGIMAPPVAHLRGSYVETGRTSFYTNPRGIKTLKSRVKDFEKDIKLLPDRASVYNLKGLNLFADNKDTSEYDVSGVYAAVPGYTPKSVTAGDILSKVPSVSTEDRDTVGIFFPPFAYFAKRF